MLWIFVSQWGDILQLIIYIIWALYICASFWAKGKGGEGGKEGSGGEDGNEGEGEGEGVLG